MRDKRGFFCNFAGDKHIRREIAKEKEVNKGFQEWIRIMLRRKAKRDKLLFDRHPAFVDLDNGKVRQVSHFQILKPDCEMSRTTSNGWMI